MDPLEEPRWIHQVAKEYGRPHAHVAQAWLDCGNAEETVAGQADFSLVRSIRHKPGASERPLPGTKAEPGGMSNPAFQRGYSFLARYGFSFDLRTPRWHLPKNTRKPRLSLTTQACPATGAEGLSAWRSAMRTFAQFSRAMVKISGLGLQGKPWHLEDTGVLSGYH